jgi:hypothetical protein
MIKELWQWFGLVTSLIEVLSYQWLVWFVFERLVEVVVEKINFEL